MVNFITKEWIMTLWTATQVNAAVPKWITQAQATIILATPQITS